jgi:hypothetical protein
MVPGGFPVHVGDLPRGVAEYLCLDTAENDCDGGED